MFGPVSVFNNSYKIPAKHPLNDLYGKLVFLKLHHQIRSVTNGSVHMNMTSFIVTLALYTGWSQDLQ